MIVKFPERWTTLRKLIFLAAILEASQGGGLAYVPSGSTGLLTADGKIFRVRS